MVTMSRGLALGWLVNSAMGLVPMAESGDASFFVQVKFRGSSTVVEPEEGEGYTWALATTCSTSSLAGFGSDRSRGPSVLWGGWAGMGPPAVRLSGEGEAGELWVPLTSAGVASVGLSWVTEGLILAVSFPGTRDTTLFASQVSSSSEGGVGAPSDI